MNETRFSQYSAPPCCRRAHDFRYNLLFYSAIIEFIAVELYQSSGAFFGERVDLIHMTAHGSKSDAIRQSAAFVAAMTKFFRFADDASTISIKSNAQLESLASISIEANDAYETWSNYLSCQLSPHGKEFSARHIRNGD